MKGLHIFQKYEPGKIHLQIYESQPYKASGGAAEIASLKEDSPENAYAQVVMVNLALASLKLSLEGGYAGKEELERDERWDSLRGTAAFEELLKAFSTAGE